MRKEPSPLKIATPSNPSEPGWFCSPSAGAELHGNTLMHRHPGRKFYSMTTWCCGLRSASASCVPPRRQDAGNLLHRHQVWQQPAAEAHQRRQAHVVADAKSGAAATQLEYNLDSYFVASSRVKSAER